MVAHRPHPNHIANQIVDIALSDYEKTKVIGNIVFTEKDTDFAIRLTKENKIASIPVSVFYHKQVDHQLLRFCFAKQNETLEKAAEKLMKI